jgi:hypothetical protein
MTKLICQQPAAFIIILVFPFNIQIMSNIIMIKLLVIGWVIVNANRCVITLLITE